MSRATTTFNLVMADVAVACDFAMSDVSASAALQEKLVNRFNRAWKRCWEADIWEDALEGATITPTAGLIPFSTLENARRFALFSEDPLPYDSAAYAIEGKTATTGIQVQSDLGTVYALWIAKPTTYTWADVAAATAIPEGFIKYDPNVLPPEDAEEIELTRNDGSISSWNWIGYLRNAWPTELKSMSHYRVTRWKIPDDYTRYSVGDPIPDSDKVEVVILCDGEKTFESSMRCDIHSSHTWGCDAENGYPSVIAYRLKDEKPALDDARNDVTREIYEVVIHGMGANLANLDNALNQFARAIVDVGKEGGV